jgi:hypothetical protein
VQQVHAGESGTHHDDIDIELLASAWLSGIKSSHARTPRLVVRHPSRTPGSESATPGQRRAERTVGESDEHDRDRLESFGRGAVTGAST